jgi:IMP dehydrogenase
MRAQMPSRLASVPGSICTTRIVAGVGVPQLTAIMDCADGARASGVPVIADGGIKYSGDLAKALAAGRRAPWLAICWQAPMRAPVRSISTRAAPTSRIAAWARWCAMARGSADRYFQAEVRDQLKLVPEGIEGQVPYKGPAGAVLHQLAGGLRAAMGYTGSATLKDLREHSEFIRISGAGLRESHVHDVQITREAPNYQRSG